MKRESAALAGSPEPAAVALPERHKSLRERLLKPFAHFAVVAAAGSLAVGNARGAVHEGELQESSTLSVERPGFIIGAIEDSVLSEDINQAQAVAEKVRSLGVNTLKVTLPWTGPGPNGRGQCAENKNDELRFQNAATATRDKGLYFAMNLIPVDGKAPISPSQQTCFKDTLIAYLESFDEAVPDGHLMVELPNEPNSATFWKPQRNAAESVARLISKTYTPLKKRAQELGLHLTIAGGSLHSRKAIDFTKDFGEALKKEKSASPELLDALSHHPYGQKNDEPPTTPHPDLQSVGLGDIDALAKAADNSLRKGIPIFESEYGVKAIVPANKLNIYKGKPNSVKNLVTEKEQANYYATAIKMARCHPRVGAIILFNVIDDPDGNWQSGGLWYADGTPKTSYELVRQAIAASNANQINC